MILRRTHIFLLLTALWTLAVAVPNLDFSSTAWRRSQRHTTLQSGEETSREAPTEGRGEAEDRIPAWVFWTGLALSAVGLTGFVVWRIRRRRKRNEDTIYRERPRQVWQAYLAIGLLFVGLSGIFWLAWHPSRQPEEIKAFQRPAERHVDLRAALPPADSAPVRLVDEFTSPTWVRYLWITLMILLAVGIGQTLRRTPRSLPPEASEPPPVVEESPPPPVESREPADPVIRYYRDMCRILGHKVAVTAEVTAREFARLLADAEVHDAEVGRLTHLFERVRYGGEGSDPWEHAEAAALLQAIESRYGRADDEG